MITLIESHNNKVSGDHLVELIKCKDCIIGGKLLEGEHTGVYDARNGEKVRDC